jgi:hypothetical protein
MTDIDTDDMSRTMKHFLLEYHRPTGKLYTLTEYINVHEAMEQRFILEQDKDPDIEVAVLTANSLDTIKQTHSRYFAANYDPELAWSTEQAPEEHPEPEQRRSWLTTASLALLIAASTVGAVIALTSAYRGPHESWQQPAPDSPPVPEIVNSPGVQPNAMPKQDLVVSQGMKIAAEDGTAHANSVYLALLKQGSISIYSTDDAIDYGHTVCGALASGMPESKVIEIEATSHPEMGWNGASVQVKAAETAYCQKYSKGQS